jgi:hypothetical protein
MFRKPTAIVLGAGASAPYGFSTGGGLVEKALSIGDGGLQRASAGILQPHEVNPLLDALRMAMTPSIDALLEHRDVFRETGKRVISALLLDEESAALSKRIDGNTDWMHWLFSKMVAGTSSLQDFVSNSVHFITFNYDRLLEYRFVNALHAQYGETKEQCWQFLRRMSIIHLHGSIGPPFDPAPNCIQVIPFGTREPAHIDGAMSNATKTISIVHDAKEKEEPFPSAHRILQAVEQVLFLGFGLGEENTRRLALDRISDSADIYYSAFGMIGREIDLAKRNFRARQGGALLTRGEEDIRSFLRRNATIVC